jgi:hypothetical protein
VLQLTVYRLAEWLILPGFGVFRRYRLEGTLLQHARNYEGQQKQCQRLLVRGLRRSGAADRIEIGLGAVWGGTLDRVLLKAISSQLSPATPSRRFSSR